MIHYLKVATLLSPFVLTVMWASGMVATAVIAIEPTVSVALIAIIPLTLTGLGTFYMQMLARKDARDARVAAEKSLENQEAMKTSMDGHFTKLLASDQAKGAELVEKTDKLSHAEGRREGIESKDKP